MRFQYPLNRAKIKVEFIDPYSDKEARCLLYPTSIADQGRSFGSEAKDL